MSSASMKLEATQASPKRANGPGQAHQSAPETDSQIAAFHDGNLQQLPSLMLQRTIGNYGLGRTLEPKLEINEPGDIYEQEADRVADQVMRMIDPTPQTSLGSSGFLQRKCHSCSEEEKEKEESGEALSRKESNGVVGYKNSTAPSIVDQVLGSPGLPLDQSTRAFMEPRFGRDLSQVRLHTDPTAAESARVLGAHAYTVGTNVVFGQGKLAPLSNGGRRLLAHELAHVIQQSDIPGLVSPNKAFLQRDEDENSSVGDSGAVPTASNRSEVKDRSNLSPGFDIDEADGRAFALAAIEKMSPFGAKVSSPPSDAIASTGLDPSTAITASNSDVATTNGVIQTSAIQPMVQRAGGGKVKPEAGFVGSLQVCYDACNGELSVVGWIWAGGGVVTSGLFGGKAWWGAYVFAEKEFLKTSLDFMPKLPVELAKRTASLRRELPAGVKGFQASRSPSNPESAALSNKPE